MAHEQRRAPTFAGAGDPHAVCAPLRPVLRERPPQRAAAGRADVDHLRNGRCDPAAARAPHRATTPLRPGWWRWRSWPGRSSPPATCCALPTCSSTRCWRAATSPSPSSSTLQALAGSGAVAYQELYLLLAVYTAAVHPPRRVGPYLLVLSVVACLPLLYQGVTLATAADSACACSCGWRCLR